MTDDKKTALKAVDWIEELLDAYAEQDCGCATLRAHVAQGEHNQKCKLIRAGITGDRPDALPCVSCGKPSDTATPDGADMCWQCFAQFNAAEYDQLRARFTALLQRDYIITDIDEAIDPLRDLPAPNKTHPLDVAPFLVFKEMAELMYKLQSVMDWLGSEVFDDDEKNAHGSTQAERAKNIRGIIRAVHDGIDKALDPLRPPPARTPTDEMVDKFAAAIKDELNKTRRHCKNNGLPWMEPNWQEHCTASFFARIKKGNPLEVATFLAFMWHHKWPTTEKTATRAPDAGLVEELKKSEQQTFEIAARLLKERDALVKVVEAVLEDCQFGGKPPSGQTITLCEEAIAAHNAAARAGGYEK